MEQTYSDCKTENGITIGLVDAVISILRVLSPRDLTHPYVVAALTDLKGDPDYAKLVETLSTINP